MDLRHPHMSKAVSTDTHTATHCKHCNTLQQHSATHTIKHTHTGGGSHGHMHPHCAYLQGCVRRPAHCNTLQHTATHCNALQHTVSHCITLQHTATHTRKHTHTHIQEEGHIDLKYPPFTYLQGCFRFHTHTHTLRHTATLTHIRTYAHTHT